MKFSSKQKFFSDNATWNYKLEILRPGLLVIANNRERGALILSGCSGAELNATQFIPYDGRNNASDDLLSIGFLCMNWEDLDFAALVNLHDLTQKICIFISMCTFILIKVFNNGHHFILEVHFSYNFLFLIVRITSLILVPVVWKHVYQVLGTEIGYFLCIITFFECISAVMLSSKKFSTSTTTFSWAGTHDNRKVYIYVLNFFLLVEKG